MLQFDSFSLFLILVGLGLASGLLAYTLLSSRQVDVQCRMARS